VRTTLGAIEGQVDGAVVAFLGVRYAAPPVGDLRFRPPEAPACAPGVTPAQAFGPRCTQIEKDAQGDIIAVHGEEDCLTLNVWTPATGAGDRPVLVFVHGGGNATGGSDEGLYHGARLAAAQDVVVVTLNYRLGALGFLAHPGLAVESPDGVSGNYGILDQIAALRWVQDNIAGFGGDPSRVLLFGESAGAVDTCTLVGSPKAAGLFHRAIVQSGACRERTLDVVLTEISEPFVANAGCGSASDLLGCLRAVPAEELVKTAPDGYPNVAALEQGWGPHVDGVVVPEATLDALAAGAHNRVPLIVGANAEETERSAPPMLTVAAYEAYLDLTFGPLADEVLALYPAATADEARAAFVAITSDIKFVCNARRTARAADAGQDEPVFRYHLTYTGYDAPFGEPSAFHGLELVYIFGNFDRLIDGFEYQPNADDLALAGLLQSAWARFAAAGDPVVDGLDWPTYAGVSTERCDFWDALVGG
jgi:para-nitrobenzyl esterase